MLFRDIALGCSIRTICLMNTMEGLHREEEDDGDSCIISVPSLHLSRNRRGAPADVARPATSTPITGVLTDTPKILLPVTVDNNPLLICQ